MPTIKIIDTGMSRSFPDVSNIVQSKSSDEILMIIGQDVQTAFKNVTNLENYQLILLELGMECLGVHTGEKMGHEGSHVLGFSRYKMGDDPATKLIELVRQNNSPLQSITLAKDFFESQEFIVAVCADVPGRIVDRLIRPYLNAVLRRLDEGLATDEDMDKTLKLGLGYPEGPLAMLTRSGIANHAEVSMQLYQTLGDIGFFPARRAQVAATIKKNLKT